MQRLSVIDSLRSQLEAEGFDPKADSFAREMRRRQIAHCQELRRTVCPECPAADTCSVLQAWLRDMRGETAR